MSDQLDKWIKENRELLDQEAPPKGHAKRFAERLTEDQSAARSANWIWSAAAAVAVLISVSILLIIGDDKVVPNDSTGLSSISSEMAEVEEHFTQEVAMKMDLMRSIESDDKLFNNNMRILDQLEDEYDLLKKDLAENEKDQRIINSMIMNYRLRIKVMDKMLDRLETINNKPQKDEDLHI